jgi:hypothetical protein|tara:strand:- start:47 stop:226 length:180 start_codon:yes stop_codon:yes gene_type:complete
MKVGDLVKSEIALDHDHSAVGIILEIVPDRSVPCLHSVRIMWNNGEHKNLWSFMLKVVK